MSCTAETHNNNSHYSRNSCHTVRDYVREGYNGFKYGIGLQKCSCLIRKRIKCVFFLLLGYHGIYHGSLRLRSVLLLVLGLLIILVVHGFIPFLTSYAFCRLQLQSEFIQIYFNYTIFLKACQSELNKICNILVGKM